MSDKQTTAFLLMVILSFVFWLYNTNRLPKLRNLILEDDKPNPGSGGINTGFAGVKTLPEPNGDLMAGFTLNKSLTVSPEGEYLWKRVSGKTYRTPLPFVG